MTPEEFCHPTIEQLSGINLYYEEGQDGPVIIGPGHPLSPEAASSDSFNHVIDADDSERPTSEKGYES